MVTTKTNLMKRMGQSRTGRAAFRRELAKHIPDLWKYANTIQDDKDKAYDLLASTISKANMMYDKTSAFQAEYQILSRLMYREYLGSFDVQKVSDLYEFSTPVRAGLVHMQPAKAHAYSCQA